jgi:hypothetical protein
VLLFTSSRESTDAASAGHARVAVSSKKIESVEMRKNANENVATNKRSSRGK